ncbi:MULTISPECIES: LacI family DNA-binding transcriptional regulator [unclassified Leifsonia]|uniref:LacI family DNA-binding transcriptional regulator n=1 Tax=unclassified Leifsonia TaxID=2663824 RepID=UPI0008A7C1BF|nr:MULTISPECIES: LacI family DNA-binding transcriptional regulator [unclassified Leifsonia]SEH57047.1 transcriptional regulator, LacI family [Leifsonia sp. CL154]SFL21803.1 transcriptional regulator, LacI family [Leifsonia sp. CL147]
MRNGDPTPLEGRRPTLADVAERAGISKGAASKILNDRPGSRLSADAAARVRAAAAELGYVANPMAQSLRLKRTRTIGFISDRVTIERYASGMIGGAIRAAEANDHTLLIAETEGDPSRLERAIDSMLDRHVDSIVFGLTYARMIDIRMPSSLPVVVVNGATPDGLPSVLPDEYEAGRMVADVLVRAGHRRIGVIGEVPHVAGDPRRSVTIARRFQGLYEVFDAAGIEPVRTVVPEWRPYVGYDVTTRLLREHPGLTAILAANDNVAFGAYQALWQAGLRIPDDISVISFDDEELAGYLRPGLTTVRLPYDEMAAIGVEQVLGLREPGVELVTMPIRLRDSVAQLDPAARRETR